MSGGDAALKGPLAASVRLGFVMLYAAVLVLGAGWASGNVRQVPPDSRAVVLRFGRVVRVRQSGLLVAWPAPIEQVWLLPSSDRQIALRIRGQKTGFVSDETDQVVIQKDDVIHMQGNRDLNNANYLMTGDGNVVRLDTTLFYTITDPAAYMLEKDRLEPALTRAYAASAVALAASRSLDDFLVARPDESGKDTNAPAGSAESVAALASRRQALRGDLVAAINRRLAALRAGGEDLGVMVGRVDLVALLPPIAKNAFDAVLTASQIADQGIASARTDAARITQEADRRRDQLLTEASAAAEERVRRASEDVAPVAALEAQETPANRETLLTHAYQEQIAAILRRAGEVTAVDARGGQGLVLPAPAGVAP
jgi:regulator of protease activity HflC (stomatin/prohibitin superfamily)